MYALVYSRSYCELYTLPSNVVSRVDVWDQVTAALAGEIELAAKTRTKIITVAMRFIGESCQQFSCNRR